MQYGKKLWVAAGGVLIACLFFAVLALYDKGYRFNGRILSPATILIAVLPEGATIELNEAPASFERREDGSASVRAVAGFSTLGISRPGYWPWQKEIFIGSGEVVRVTPFFVPQETSGVLVLKEDPAYRVLKERIASFALPTRDNPARSDVAPVILFVEGSSIKAAWTGGVTPPPYLADELTVLSFDAELRDLAFMPGRGDVALLAIQNGVFALELDTRGVQNFQPVYKGSRPVFAVIDGALYIQENDSVFEIDLD